VHGVGEGDSDLFEACGRLDHDSLWGKLLYHMDLSENEVKPLAETCNLKRNPLEWRWKRY
jgi:hypothetical protein